LKGIWVVSVIIVLFILVSGTFLPSFVSAQENAIPAWIKNNAGWWAEGLIGDSDFLQGIQFLIKEGIVVIPETKQGSTSSDGIPEWVKNNAKWWSDGQIGDSDFVTGIQFLVQNGIIVIEQPDPTLVEDEKTITKANAIFVDGEFTGCGRGYDAEPSFFDITYYQVENGDITLYENLEVPDEIRKWQDDTNKHEEILSHLSQIVPPKYMDEIAWVTIFTDGVEWQEMDVWPDEETERWDFVIDIQEYYCLGSLNKESLTRTMIHEFGHMITLGESQVSIDYELADAWFKEGDFKQLFVEREQQCSQTFMTHSGCSKPDSYINTFMQKFEIGKFSDSLNYQETMYSNEWLKKLDDFYSKHETGFVTDYAASDAHEDIAESWTAFVLKEKPDPNTIQDKKILFFYDYPELVEVRDYIRNNL